MSTHPVITNRVGDALKYAAEVHQKQYRKGATSTSHTKIPYISHPMSVAAMVIEYGGDEDQAIAGLLHDAIEDGQTGFEKQEILDRFGEEVLRLVLGCTDGSQEEKQRPQSKEEKKALWQQRKTTYIEHLQVADDRILLVSGCDKLHNARSCLRDIQTIGLELYSRFLGGEAGTLWYYSTLADVFEQRNTPVCIELRQTVHQLIKETKRLHLQNTNQSYVDFDEKGMQVDLNRYLRTEEGQKALHQIAQSAFPKKKS